ncbi:BEN domain-containing protein 3 isoform X1 [Ornithorhynchus anatinus]|uniref:BEN domain containing 3 n=1 Tax=Ornithorhynchus anatinus TaxID=9258 RepID=A0A6I8PMG7_ORNAN|nr:BEN domain-containing protein 3 isoform X1 [Ornithorhynchus anatinus]XP_028903227.1 BEN domain-containing protein 3 isoform X1 [Ornithorhynchus anatinus]XP_039770742.1 BEN domain-containing protein 3 isoform X1 [Ornithorhynchus anatinus]
MNAAEFSDDHEEVAAPQNNAVKVEEEEEEEEEDTEDAVLDCSVTSRTLEKRLRGGCLVPSGHEPNKRKLTAFGGDGQGARLELLPSGKKRRLIPEGLLVGMKNRDGGSPTQGSVELPCKGSEPGAPWPGEDGEPFTDGTTSSSYKKPLYGISHKITEKKNPAGAEPFTTCDPYERVSRSHSPSPLRLLGDARKREGGGGGAAGDGDPNVYALIQKMFYTLNSLHSNMTQLHSKVDLLSLEVSRIKRHLSPGEPVAEFQPPPEYQLTAAELKQITEHSASGGDLACRLLVQLFPELFGDEDLGRGCGACGFLGKKQLGSLHLQLIRNYVEACYPAVKNTAVWQVECLPQVNDFFNRFWAQREMEGGPAAGGFYATELGEPARFLDAKERDETLSLERSSPAGPEQQALDAQDLHDFLDEASSPGEFAVFLLHRLFPELFDQPRLGEPFGGGGGGCCGGKRDLDPQRLQLIRRYTEIYFPDVQEEEVWLQQCARRLHDELDGSEGEAPRDDELDGGDEDDEAGDEDGEDEEEDGEDEGGGLPDDVSVIKVEDGSDLERPGRRSKKIWLVPVDFDKLDIPPPDFEVPGADCLLSKEQIRCIYESSLSIGNFASRLLVHLFPELFTPENLRKQYNCSGSLGKKQLDPARVRLIRHYVQLLYPRAKNDRVWTLEFVGKLDERCRRRDTEQRRSYQQQRKVHVPGPDRRDFLAYAINPERFREELDGPPLPPERSSKDFCKIPLDELAVPAPDFPVPSLYLLSDKEVREIVQQSLSVGNFAARLLVRLFPELFTPENLRLQYNHSGACNKKQLDPVRLRLIRHYVEAVYPVDKMEEVWHYECIPSIDERCRRPNRKKCDILKKAKKAKKCQTV